HLEPFISSQSCGNGIRRRGNDIASILLLQERYSLRKEEKRVILNSIGIYITPVKQVI
ncbi:hypothetical protein Leryth_001359, partial [Lithospermum erythrorhizon]